MTTPAKKLKQQRLTLVIISLVLLSGAVALMLRAMDDGITFFISPSEVAEGNKTVDERFRLGGLVEVGSVSSDENGLVILFNITDNINSTPVRYRDLLPDLFREGQGVIAEGSMNADGVFVADKVLAKHDENYMPPEVAEMLERAGKTNNESYENN
jgi:cytochrome c-type biogenesis protein CcmE